MLVVYPLRLVGVTCDTRDVDRVRFRQTGLAEGWLGVNFEVLEMWFAKANWQDGNSKARLQDEHVDPLIPLRIRLNVAPSFCFQLSIL
jgi:hypothetical protein